MFTAFVTGSSRGLGLALTEEILQRPDAHVIAAVRTIGVSGRLLEVQEEHGGRITEVQLDYYDEQSIARAAGTCFGIFGHLDVLVNCGALSTADKLPAKASAGPMEELRGAALRALFQVNVVGPIVLSQKLLPLLRRASGAAILNISSIRASATAAEAGSVGYSVTKAALNMASRKFAAELKKDGIGVVSIHPGWMRTRMGGVEAPLLPAEVAHDIMSVIQHRALELTGRFVDKSGANIAW